jgi:hypothetical protein
MHNPTIPHTKAAAGPLELDVRVMTVAEMIPAIAISRMPSPLNQRATSKGIDVAPKVPARIETSKGP